MTKLMAILSLVMTFSAAVHADEKSENMIASALISRQIQTQVAEFNQLVDYVSNVKIVTYEDLDTIILSGTVVSGDIACGSATLTINRSSQPGFGFNRLTVYHAEVTTDLVPNCK